MPVYLVVSDLSAVSTPFGLLVPNEAVEYLVVRDITKTRWLSLFACEANVNHFVTRFSINWNHLTKDRQVRSAHTLSLRYIENVRKQEDVEAISLRIWRPCPVVMMRVVVSRLSP